MHQKSWILCLSLVAFTSYASQFNWLDTTDISCADSEGTTSEANFDLPTDWSQFSFDFFDSSLNELKDGWERFTNALEGQFTTLTNDEGSTFPWTPTLDRFNPLSSEVGPSDSIDFHSLSLFVGKEELKTGFGSVLGNVYSSYRTFLGIPYGEAPIGELRWMKARPYEYTSGKVFDARKHGKHCIQLDTWKSSYFRDLMLGLDTKPSEDCLNLNVYTPSKDRLRKLPGGKQNKVPVLVFIHGGMFTTGGTAANIYNPSEFVERNDVVVVTMNYRMSIWGFLASKELAEESPEVGNYGLTDVILALQWVKKYIHAFGGDPNNVTVAGHSAGSIMVNYLLFTLGTETYKRQGLIHRAIMFSGSYNTGMIRNLDEARNDVTMQGVFDRLVELVGCGEARDKVECLRDVSAESLQSVGVANDWAYHWGPVIDGQYIRAHPKTLAERGLALNIPILITDCIDDGTVFSADEPTATYVDYLNVIKKYFGTEAVAEVAPLYKPNTSGTDGTPYFEPSSMLLRDALISCPADEFGGLLGSRGFEVHYLRFKKPLSLAWLFTTLPGVPDYGVFHGTELLFLFQGIPQLTVAQSATINNTQRRIANFMKGGLPDDPVRPKKNPSRLLTGQLQIDPICRAWEAWPLSKEFIEDKFFAASNF